MKKQYLKPSLDAVKFHTANMIAASIPVNGETDDEARSKAFWGETLFDDEEESDENYWF